MSQPQCHYHPDKRASGSCPTCHQRICDRCRLQGNSLRCGTCQSNYQKGGDDPKKKQRVQCANHPGVPTDQRCVGCRKPHCAACLNGASKCFNCALKAPSAAPAGRRSPTTPLKKGKATGKLKQPPRRGKPWGLIAGGVAAVAVLGVAAALLLKPAPPPKPYKVAGPLKVAITAPSTQRTLSGFHTIKLQVASAQDVELVELTIDGKYWDKFKQPPFESEWPTSLHANGKHTIVAKAIYKDKRAVSAKRVVRTWNR